MRGGYDLIVIGSGPAGEKAASHASYFGRRVLVLERHADVGGAPVGTGGIPTKTLRDTALFLDGFRRADVYGMGAPPTPPRAGELARERNRAVQHTMTARVRDNLTRHDVDIVQGSARLTADHDVAITLPGGEQRVAGGRAILIATGSRPLRPSVFAIDDPRVLDSDLIAGSVDVVPRMLIAGGGPIGCEYASIYTLLGTRVTLVNAAERLIPLADAEISDHLCAALVTRGVDVRLGTTVVGVEPGVSCLRVHLTDGSSLDVDRLLVAVGRSGQVGGLDLDVAGVQVDRLDHVVVDGRFATSADGVYAAGDVIGPPAIASVAMEEGRRAASHAIGSDYRHAATSTPALGVYSIPEVAMAGLTEEQASAAGIDHVTGRASFAGNARAVIAGSTDGMLKLLFAREDRRLLGVHMVCDGAAEIVHLGQAVVQLGGTLDYFIHTALDVPTWSEAYKYAAFDALAQLE